MILPEASVDDDRRIADRMHRGLAEPLVVDDEPQSIAISIGIAGPPAGVRWVRFGSAGQESL